MDYAKITKREIIELIESKNAVIATKHRSAGNDTVGDMWTETMSFDLNTPVGKIMEWAGSNKGHLILTYDEAKKPKQIF